MARRWLTGGLAAAALVWAGTAGGEQISPSPEAGRIFDFEIGAGRAWGMSAEPGGGVRVGLELVCRTEEPAYAEATAYFGGWPEDRRPVRLKVQSPDGTTTAWFGRAVSGKRDSELHIPRVTDLRELERFVEAALRPGALVSNGYRAFWNRASGARNAEVRREMLDCVDEMERGRRNGNGTGD